MEEPDKLAVKLQSSDDAALEDFEVNALEKKVEEIPKRAEEIIKEATKPEKEEEESEKVPDKPEEKSEEAKDELQKRLDAIQPKKNAHPNTEKGYAALKGIIAEQKEGAVKEKKEKDELLQKLATIETEFKTKAITPEIEKELESLRELRRTHYIENDPAFQDKYSNRLKEIDDRAIGILKLSNLKPSLEEYIRAQGGVVAMYNSTKQMSAPFEEHTQQQFIEDVMIPKLPTIQQTRIQQAIGAGIDLREEMSREIAHAKTHGPEIQQQRNKELEELFNKAAIEERKKFGKRGEKWEVLSTDSKEEKANKEKHNARVEKAEALFQDYVRDGNKNPAKVAEALARAAQSQYLMEEAEDKDKELEARNQKIKELEEQIKKVKGSAPANRNTSAPPPSSAPQPGQRLSDEEALKTF